MAAELPVAVPGSSRAPALMSMTEIAELAGVKRPVVTTWRRRYPGFPSPAGGDAMNPLFSAREVADWLIATGRDPEGRIESDLRLHTLAGLGTGLSPRNLVALVTALICLRHLDGEPLSTDSPGAREDLMHRGVQADPSDACLVSELALLPADAGPLAEAVDELIEAAWGCREAFERIIAASQRLASGDLYARTVSPALARLTAGLSGARERARERTIVVCDPAAGPGGLLAAVADATGPDYELTFQAADPEAYFARLAHRRLHVHGASPAGLRVAASAELPSGWADPDVIVTHIGYVPGESRSPAEVVDRVDDIALRLAPCSTAVVAGPADVLAGELRPYSPAERARAALLSSGMVEAIIRLPGGLVPFRPGYEVAVWVLTSAYDSPWRGWVLLADVSDRELSAGVTDALVEDVVTWRRDGYRPHAHTRTFGVQVRVSDLVDGRRPLSARASASFSSRRTEEPAGLVTHITELEAGLERLAATAATARQPIRGQFAAAHRASPPTQTIKALVKARRLTLLPGTRLHGVQPTGEGHHDIIGVPELLGRAGRGDRRIDRVTLAGLPRAHLTEPGDVIVTVTPGFGVLVDHTGLAVAEFPARVLRIPATERDSFTPRTLAALLEGRLPSLRPAGAVRPRRLEEHELPMLSPAEVRFLDQFLTALDARQEAAQQELNLLTELRHTATSGLFDGRLTFTQTTPPHTGQ